MPLREEPQQRTPQARVSKYPRQSPESFGTRDLDGESIPSSGQSFAGHIWALSSPGGTISVLAMDGDEKHGCCSSHFRQLLIAT